MSPVAPFLATALPENNYFYGQPKMLFSLAEKNRVGRSAFNLKVRTCVKTAHHFLTRLRNIQKPLTKMWLEMECGNGQGT